jgi:hypothetical protein
VKASAVGDATVAIRVSSKSCGTAPVVGAPARIEKLSTHKRPIERLVLAGDD